MSLRGYLETRNQTTPSDTPEKTAPSGGNDGRPRIVRSEELLRGDFTLQIAHGDEVYTLRKTRAGKLYLVK